MRTALPALFAALLMALGAGCGRTRAPGGQGTLDVTPDQVPLLVLEGSPYEMGWWHGHLLRGAILERAGAARRLQPADYIEAFADQGLHRLGERLRQELDGMAAATGLTPLDLMRAEVAPELLRFKGAQATLVGMAGLAPTVEGFEARLRYGGAGMPAFCRDTVVIHRKPTGRPESLGLCRRGSLGAWAYVTAEGRGYLLAEVDVTNANRKGFGGGRPFEMAAREALDATADVEQFAAELNGSMGHTGLGFSLHPTELPRVRAMGGVQIYTAPDLPWDLGARPFLAVGPYGDPESPDAKALQAQVVAPPELSLDERWLRLEGLGGLPLPAGTQAPTLTIKAVGEVLSLAWLVPNGNGRHVEVALAR